MVAPQTTTYYAVGGKRVAADVNGTFYYFGYDALGSQVAVLDASGNLVGAQLYGPYGASRYNTGTLPTSIGFTGQRADSVTGLDYYNARYYDPGVGQFLSVDGVQGNAQGMDPYAYVGGNPESQTDPSGNMHTCSDIAAGCEGESGGGGSSTPTSGCGPCHDPNKPWPGSGSGSSAGSGGGGTSPTKPTPTPTSSGRNGSTNKTKTNPSGHSTCGADKSCQDQKSTLKLTSADNDLLTKISLVMDGLGLITDFATILSLKTIGTMGAIGALLQGIATIGHAIHFIANIIIALNNGAIPPWVQNMLAIGNALMIAGNLLNVGWLALGWLGSLGEIGVVGAAPELVPIVMGSSALLVLGQLAMAMVQTFWLDPARVDLYNVENESPDQRIQHCVSTYGAASCT